MTVQILQQGPGKPPSEPPKFNAVCPGCSSLLQYSGLDILRPRCIGKDLGRVACPSCSQSFVHRDDAVAVNAVATPSDPDLDAPADANVMSCVVVKLGTKHKHTAEYLTTCKRCESELKYSSAVLVKDPGSDPALYQFNCPVCSHVVYHDTRTAVDTSVHLTGEQALTWPNRG